jgi:hypothetical protein
MNASPTPKETQPPSQPSQLHLAVARLARQVEQMTARLSRLETSHASLRRRTVVNRREAQAS